jgi:hypothetical protein
MDRMAHDATLVGGGVVASGQEGEGGRRLSNVKVAPRS